MKLLLTTYLLFVVNLCSAQTAQIDFRKHIIVSGSAEMVVQPDEVELEIVLGNSKKTGKALDYSQAETEFKALMKKHNIKPETVVFDTSDYWHWWFWWSDRYNSDARVIKLKVDNKTDLLQFVKDLDSQWSVYLRIVNSTSKDLQRFRKEVKMEAIKAAKQKAEYLLESVGEKLGGILAVEELPEQNYNSFWNSHLNNNVSNVLVSGGSSPEAIAGIQEIKLRYEIKVKFEIK
jgi:hypothetical protein